MVGRRDLEMLLLMGVIYYGFDRSAVPTAPGDVLDRAQIMSASTDQPGFFNFSMDARR